MTLLRYLPSAHSKPQSTLSFETSVPRTACCVMIHLQRNQPCQCRLPVNRAEDTVRFPARVKSSRCTIYKQAANQRSEAASGYSTLNQRPRQNHNTRSEFIRTMDHRAVHANKFAPARATGL